MPFTICLASKGFVKGIFLILNISETQAIYVQDNILLSYWKQFMCTFGFQNNCKRYMYLEV
jgi:hypothetical protein